MKPDNVVRDKSYAFAVRIVRLYQHLAETRQEFILSKQLLKSGTSIGANVEEALGGQSRRDFVAKMSISYKEARESHYWIRLMSDTDYLTAAQSKSLLHDAEELLKIIGSILKTSKQNGQASN